MTIIFSYKWAFIEDVYPKSPCFFLFFFQTIAKFDLERAKEALQWVEAVTGEQLEPRSEELKDQLSVKQALKNGTALCQ